MLILENPITRRKNFASWPHATSLWMFEYAHSVALRDSRLSVVLDVDADDVASDVRIEVMTRRHASEFSSQERLAFYVRAVTESHVLWWWKRRGGLRRVILDLDELPGPNVEEEADGV